MKLTREQLIAISEVYFEACNDHDLTQCTGTFADDCLMWFPSASFKYDGIEPLTTHFKDFFKTFKKIHFRDYRHIADADSQSVVTYFKVSLVPHEGEDIHMQNCNIFHVNENGLFEEIIIYNSGALSAGFQEGNAG